MSQALKTRVNNLAAEVSSLRDGTVNLASSQELTGLKAFLGGFRGKTVTLGASPTVKAVGTDIFGGRVLIMHGGTPTQLTVPTPVAGATFFLQFHLISSANLTISTGMGSAA